MINNYLRPTLGKSLLLEEFLSCFKAVLRIRIRFILVSRIWIRIRFNETDLDPDPGSKKSAKIMENFHENQRKSLEYHTFFQNY